MAPFLALFLLMLSLISSTSSSQNHLKLLHQEGDKDVYCESWRFAAETDDLLKWNTTPKECMEYVKSYISMGQYELDLFFVAKRALEYAKTLRLAGGGKDIWIFDIDETLISTIGQPGSKVPTEFVTESSAGSEIPRALPSILWLYNELRALGFEIVIMSIRLQDQRNATVNQLLNAGYNNSWAALILRGNYDLENPVTFFKADMRGQLSELGYIIHGNVGDQWSDMWGPPMARRSFKLPNPMYYVF
ncbi:acid phosphatase 1-like [Typha angustifolia]|uniref:acid phosphatase 1-like n=1 Tax=Typha angustifolia TaxID=59011 RepID=UPI003C2E3A6F